MTTITVSSNMVFGVPKASDGYWDRVWNRAKEMFERFTGMLEPYFGPARLDYLDGSANLSAKEMAVINADLHGVMTN